MIASRRPTVSALPATPPAPSHDVLVVDDPDVGKGARTTLWTVRLLGDAGYRPYVMTPDPRSMAAASRRCAGRLPLSRDADEQAVREAVAGASSRRRYVAVLATGDRGVLALHPGHAGLIDKRELAGRVADAGLTSPETWIVADRAEAMTVLDGSSLPLVVKPACGHGARVAPDRATFERSIAGPFPMLVQPFLDEPISSVAGVRHRGRFLALVHQRFTRIWPPDAGMASASVTTPPDLELEERIGVLLDDYEGVFQVQFIGTHVMDVNLRVYASLSLARAAGVNLPAIYCDAARGISGTMRRARTGVTYRWFDGDIRHVASEVRSGHLTWRDAASILRPRPGTVRGGPESVSDPGPLAVRLRAELAALGKRSR